MLTIKPAKQADDLPAYALASMKAASELCEDIFPNVKREDLKNIFVQTYFSERNANH